MSLPTPDLDDRGFQDLVDDARRLVRQRCPEWSDHNLSDPGITLIEAFATITDQLLYRLNRVPDRHYVKFLDLIGVKLFSASAARVPVTFWLSARRETTVLVPAGAEVSTLRTEGDEGVVFSTVRDLAVVPCTSTAAVTQAAAGQPVDQAESLAAGRPFAAFGDAPAPGDALLVGLSGPVPSCIVTLRLDCRVEGVGVDPDDPPLLWEAWTDTGWQPCELDSDGSGGLNRPGDVVLHVPDGHVASVLAGRRAGWLRCRLLEAELHQPTYVRPPRVRSLSAFTIGGTVAAVHATSVAHEELGRSEGVPGQRFLLQHRPVVPGDEPHVLEVAGDGGWQEWAQVPSFAGSSPADRHFVLDPVAGAVELPPAVREPDGRLRALGAVPRKGVVLRLRGYRTGGGSRGNVERRSLVVPRTTVPFVHRVENRQPARGGVDVESVDSARARGPLLLRTRDRAVTAEDYEHLAREAAPDVARVHCVAAGDGADAGGVRVLVVPAAPVGADGRLEFASLVPSDAMLSDIASYLDERRVLGARISVGPPLYQGITVVAQLTAGPRASAPRLREDAVAALHRWFNPLVGGPEGTGWPFGRPVQVGDVYALLQRLPGTEIVDDVRLFAADPRTGARGDATQRVDVGKHVLVLSYEHQVRVRAT